ncbi:HEAT repeat domain-containing protein [candidate division TA06 bacterium]|nr:HEAT repeat domain-containing protein [candidate division TA06 bacterium]
MEEKELLSYHLGCSTQHKPFALPGAKPHYARDRVIDVDHIKLDLSFDIPKKCIYGKASLTFSPINGGTKVVEFDSVELKIQSVRSNGKKIPFDVTDEKLRVRFPKPLPTQKKTTVTIKYEGSPRRGLYFVGPDKAYPKKPIQIWSQGEDEDNRHWFPCYDYPNDKATSEVIVTVPQKYFALSNGKHLRTTHNRKEKTKTYHYRQTIPHVSYLITLVIGEFVEVKDSFDGIPVLYYVHPKRTEEARRSFGNTPKMLKFFSEKIGVNYPYERYSQICVSDFIFGGMENTTATTQTELTLHDKRAHLDFTSDPLVAHELAHQWWGDLLTCKDWSHGWLNEGFATYFEALWKEHHLGKDEFLYGLYQEAQNYFKEDRERYRRSIVTKVYHQPMDLFDTHLYEKGALVLHMLRYYLGDDLFFKALHHYCVQHRGESVETSDLMKAIEETTGKNVEGFFDQWIFKGGHPDFKVQFEWDEEMKSAKLNVQQKQTVDETTPLFQMHLEVEFTTSKGKTTHRIHIQEKEQVFYFPLSEKPRMVRFDKGNWILKTLDFPRPKDFLLYQLKKDDDPMGRIEAAQALAKMGNPEIVERLKEALLTEKFWGVQGEIAQALGTIHSQASLQALLKGLKVKHPKARRRVVRALGEFRRDEEAAKALLPILKKDPSYFVEGEAALSLGKNRSRKAFQALKDGLKKESWNETIRIQVFAGLGELKDERAIGIAKEWSTYGNPPLARLGGISCLGRLGDHFPQRKNEILDHLIPLLHDPDFRPRLAAVGALGVLKDEKAIPHLEQVIGRELDGRMKRRAREVIQKIREGKDKGDEVKKLREDFDKLREENRQLRDRLDRIEAKKK